MPQIVLASQSTSRRRLLEGAGISPLVKVSNVDEETDFFNAMTPADMVIALAVTKAQNSKRTCTGYKWQKRAITYWPLHH